MSSLFAHVTAGLACYVFSRQPSEPANPRLLTGCVALAVLPDLDYPVWWLLHQRIDPRLTHSLIFCVLSALLVWRVLVPRDEPRRMAHLLTLLLAACSHLLLDFLVGVYGQPLLWPLLSTEFRSPLGLLPSAGALRIDNLYLWRNLLIEAGVLVPVIVFFMRIRHTTAPSLPGAVALCILSLWVFCVGWSVSLQR